MSESLQSVIIVTGANVGIGKELVWLLLERQKNVIITCRSEEKIQSTIEEMKARWKTKNPSTDGAEMPRMNGFVLELCQVETVQKCVEDIQKYLKENNCKVAALVNNAGANFTTFETTSLNLERTFHGNHLGPYLFTLGLLPTLVEHAEELKGKDTEEDKMGVRIVNVSSAGHSYPIKNVKAILDDASDPLDAVKAFNSAENFSGMFKTYGTSKLFNLWFARSLQEYIDAKYGADFPLYVSSLHPGVIKSEISRNMNAWFAKNVILPVFSLFLLNTPSGASGMLYLALSPEAHPRGDYYVRVSDPKTTSDFGQAKAVTPTKLAQDAETRKKFMVATQKYVAANLQTLPQSYKLQL